MTKRKLESEEELKTLENDKVVPVPLTPVVAVPVVPATATTPTPPPAASKPAPVAISVDEESKEEEEESDEEISEDESEDDKPKKPAGRKAKKPAAKRAKKAAEPKIVRPTLRNALACLSHPNLIKMVQMFLEDKHPELKDEFLDCLPPPSADHIKDEFSHLIREVFRAFPNARFGSNRDNYAYKRVASPLRALKTSFNTHSKKIIDSKQFNFYLSEFLKVAINAIHNIPTFDDSKNNAPRDSLLKKLVTNGKTAVRSCTLSKKQLTTALHYSEKETGLADLTTALKDKIAKL
ncbi:hypothetical protein CYY_007998 [Polysphondylium violaceum]|uniref:Uncharacterized protein n=1 Tax=Polysphondylium violaceum TaxID=133409 RepID=A0A8J4PNJ9_9MYCE|nr:hypothetical protein CYY_007998 [Polysphondylium violaceum]